VIQQLSHQPGLPNSGLAHNSCQTTPALAEDGSEGHVQRAQLVASPNQGRVQAPTQGLRRRHHPEQPECTDRDGLPLHREGLQSLRLHGVTDEAVGCLPQQDVSGSGVLLKAGSKVHRVADGDTLPAIERTDDDLAGIDAHAGLKTHSPLRSELFVQEVEVSPRLIRCTDRPEDVVLMGKGGTKYPKDRVADELRHRASVALDDCLRPIEVTTHHSGERFGVKALSESRRSHDVAE
jgi:hypothetical protein